MIDLVQVDNPVPNQDAPSPISVTDELKKSGKPFDHGLFQQKIGELKTAVLETGGIVFIPLIWGMPSPNESIITPNNRLVVRYDPKSLLTLSGNTLRNPIPSRAQIGPFVVDDHTSEPDPMRESDVESRVQMARAFDRLRFPHKPNRFHQTSGVTTLTDQEGNVRVSMNCPYPFRPSQDSLVSKDDTLPVPFTDALSTKIFYAAYLRKMGFEPDFIANALSFPPTPATEIENGVYNADAHGRIRSALHSIPALDSYFSFNPENHERTWTPPEGVTASPEDVYKAIMTTAQFQPDGNITFDINPPQQPQTSLVPALPQ